MTKEKSLVVRQTLTPSVWEMLSQVGMAFAKSQRFGILNPSEGAIKALFCFENDLPITAARGLYIVNGKLGIESGIIAAQMRRHPDYDYKITRLNDKGCTIEVYRYDELIGEASFTEEHAKRAGLLSKGTYKKFPDDLYFAKAITRAMRRYAPDVFMQPVYASEDMQDWQVVDAEVKELPPIQPLPTHNELIEKFGLAAFTKAGGMSATTDVELQERGIADKLDAEASKTHEDLTSQFGAEAIGDTINIDELHKIADQLALEAASKENNE